MKFGLLLVFARCICSCVTDVDLDFPKTSPVVVVEGLLTDEKYDKEFWHERQRENAGNYVRLTYSNPLNTYNPAALAADSVHYAIDMATYVRNALVVIHDDFGQADTLKADSTRNEPFSGYYTINSFVCVAGRNYYLDVWANGEHYFSKAFMEPVPSLDSIGVAYIKRPIDKFSGYSPLLYFHKSTKKTQYYLTKVTAVPYFTDLEDVPPFPHFNSAGTGPWNYSIVSSEYLPEYVRGLSITLGATSSTYDVGTLESGQKYDACLFSLSKEAYDYYDVLIKSFQNDGGAYSPSPASPPSNIKGGALGFFSVSSASIKRFKVN